MKYFIANWKANKNLRESLEWIDKFLTLQLQNDRIKVVICPPFPLLYPLKEKIKKAKNIYLGSQDISQFESGSYTGEVTAKSLQGLVDYAIIGHSERRKHFQENEGSLAKKVFLAQRYQIEPIFCIRNENDHIARTVKIVAYEPVAAIGTGKNEELSNILAMKKKLAVAGEIAFLYGGSVNKANANIYLKSSQIDGLLIGGASLDPRHFFEIIKSWSKI